jgi:hypothetical protein
LPSKNIRTEIYGTIIVLVLCGGPTWSFTLREEHILRMFENRVLRNMLGPKKEEETGGLRKLHRDRFRDLYCLPNTTVMIKLRGMSRVVRVVCRGEKRNACRVSVQKPEGKTLYG